MAIQPLRVVCTWRKSNDRPIRKQKVQDVAKGERMPHAVLTEELVRKIRSLKKPGYGAKKIIKELGIEHIKEATVHSVLQGKTWCHVK